MSALAIAAVKTVVPFPPPPERVARGTSADWMVRSDYAGRVQWTNAAARAALGDAPDLIGLLALEARRLGSAPLGEERLWFGSAVETPLASQVAKGNRLLADIHRRKQAQNSVLLRTHATLDERARHELRIQIISAVEAERGRIARDLHDNTGQALAGILLNLEVVGRHLGTATNEALKALTRSRDLASRTLDQIRRISHDLHLPEWKDLDFDQAVEWLIDEMGVREKLEVRLERIEMPADAPAESKTALYRALQEALTNILRHSKARHVVIGTTANPDGVRLVVEDDGRGFDPASQEPGRGGGGIGLANVRRRVALLGGALELRSAPGRGVRLSAFVPSRKGMTSGAPMALSSAAGG